MGDISEMILDGILDQYTGEYLGDAVGYPRSRKDMNYRRQDLFTDEERKYGIYAFFGKSGLTKKQRREILIAFYPDTPGRELLSNLNLCIHASINFKKFVQFVDNWKKQNKAI